MAKSTLDGFVAFLIFIAATLEHNAHLTYSLTHPAASFGVLIQRCADELSGALLATSSSPRAASLLGVTHQVSDATLWQSLLNNWNR